MQPTTVRFTAFVINIIIVITEIIGLILCLNDGGTYNFVYFTVLSNVLAMIVSAIYCTEYVLYHKNGESDLPSWLRKIRYMTTNCLALTFFIVMTVLVPLGYPDLVDDLLVRGPQPFHHIFCPLISIVSFCLFEEGILTNKDIIIAVIPTLAYAIVSTTIVSIKNVEKPPYPFLEVRKQPIYMSIFWFIAILAVSAGLAWILKFLTRFNLLKNSNGIVEDNGDNNVKDIV